MMPPAIVVDTSVLVATVTAREPKHRDAREFMQLCANSGGSVVVPAIALAEFGAGLSRTGRTPVQARRFMTMLRSQQGFFVVPVTVELGEVASEIAILQKTKGCDSVYLALARSMAVPLVSLDREQLDRAPADVEALTPEQAIARWWPK
jgi:predicted nucleic acid-binding protein